MRHYLINFVTATTLAVVVVVGVNWLVDPYQIFGAPKIAGFNAIKTRLGPNERIFKIVNLARQQPTSVFLGTSRADIGLSPLHQAFTGKKTVNLAMTAEPYALTRMLVDHLNPAKTRQIIFGIDFFAANDLLTPADAVAPENFSTYRKSELLMSISTMMDSFKTVSEQVPGIEYTNEGQVILNNAITASTKGIHQVFTESEQTYLTSVYLPEPNCTFEFDAAHHGQSPMENVQAVFARSYRENIDLRLFISPSHARQWETLAAAGLWDKWEEWKRRLAKMNEGEAIKAGKPPFPIWDFSGYNSISIESVPALRDTKNTMQNYSDSSHYTSAVGNLILDRMFDYHVPGRKAPDDFGVRITSANLDAHLAHIRVEREQYRRTHPGDVAEIEALAQKVAQAKHCVVDNPK